MTDTVGLCPRACVCVRKFTIPQQHCTRATSRDVFPSLCRNAGCRLSVSLRHALYYQSCPPTPLPSPPHHSTPHTCPGSSQPQVSSYPYCSSPQICTTSLTLVRCFSCASFCSFKVALVSSLSVTHFLLPVRGRSKPHVLFPSFLF